MESRNHHVMEQHISGRTARNIPLHMCNQSFIPSRWRTIPTIHRYHYKVRISVKRTESGAKPVDAL